MLQIEFNHNYNGKLITDYFPDIRQFNAQIHFVGNRFTAMYKSITLGTVEIVAVRSFPLRRLSDTCSFLNVGKSPAYQEKLLQNYYNSGKPLNGEFQLAQIVFTWFDRDIQTQSELLKEWWEAKQSLFKISS